MTQMPLLQPDADWQPTPVAELPSWANARRVAVDVETCDPHLKKLGPGVRRGAYIVGISFAIEDGPSHYLPVRHEGGDNLDPDKVFGYLQDQAQTYQGDICGANLQYDLDFLAQEQVVWRKARFFRDCQIAEPLIDELQDTYSLQAISERYGIPGKDESLLREAAEAWKIDPKHEMWKLPARHVGPYATQDALLPLQLLRRQERIIEDEDIWDVYDLESRVLPVLVKMRRRGVRVDLDKLSQVEHWSEEEEHNCLKQVKEETGITIKVGDVWKATAVAKVLEKVGVEVPRTPKTKQPSVDITLLGNLDHPVARMLERARKVNKLRTTFASSVREHLVGDRIHCTFNQLRQTNDQTDEDKGARYGRLSSSDPNLQQQPSRDEWAAFWRSIYVPEEGKLWCAADYSQQEPRVLTHYAYLARCRGAEQAVERYRNDPDTDNHTLMARTVYGLDEDAEPNKKDRGNAKIIFLGLCYGMGGAKLARDLGLPTEWERIKGKLREVAGDEAKSLLNQFNRQVPFVRQLADMCESKAKRVGFIRTLSGRKCRFPVDEEQGGYDWTHKALNRLIQGAAADQTKQALVAADAAGHFIQLQIHDEIDGSVRDHDEAHALGDVMRNCTPLELPSKVDVEVGANWGEAEVVRDPNPAHRQYWGGQQDESLNPNRRKRRK